MSPKTYRRLDYGSDIPGARDLLEAALVDLKNGNLTDVENSIQQALSKMHRTKASRVTRPRNVNLTKQQKRDVEHLLRTTDKSQQQIAEEVGVNPGRVSEINNGLR